MKIKKGATIASLVVFSFALSGCVKSDGWVDCSKYKQTPVTLEIKNGEIRNYITPRTVNVCEILSVKNNSGIFTAAKFTLHYSLAGEDKTKTLSTGTMAPGTTTASSYQVTGGSYATYELYEGMYGDGVIELAAGTKLIVGSTSSTE